MRCALDGRDITEFHYRLEEATSLAGRISNAPLTRFDAEVVCRERWMATIKYCLPITRFTQEQCHKLSIVIEKALLPKLGFNRHMPKTVLYGPLQYGGKQLMNPHTEQTILHTEKIMAHLRGGDDIGKLQLILLNKQQLVSGAKDFLFQLQASRYTYCEHNEIVFLWKKLSSLNIKLDIKGAWKPTLKDSNDCFLMEKFIDQGYGTHTLEILNDIRVYMRVVVLSDICTQGSRMSKWALAAHQNICNQWQWPPREFPLAKI